MTKTGLSQISFGPFVLDAGNARLLREGQPVDLTPKALDMLQYLASRPDRLVTKEELLSAVWPDVVVSDASVKVCVREIRAALEDDAKAPTYIDTVHRRGYRFIGSVAGEDRGEAAAEASQGGPSPQSGAKHAIVGRDGELWRLSEYLRRAREGQRQCVFVSGEPGTGKTALVETFLQSVQALDGVDEAPLVLAGHCFEQFGISAPYMPLWEAIGRLARQRRWPALETLLARHNAAYGPGADPGAGGGGAATEPRAMSDRLLREMADAIETLASTTPVILFLEDLHWADYSTLDLISALVRRRTAAKLMILATYRPVEVVAGEHPLGGLVQGLLIGGLCREIPVGFLERLGVAEFLSTRLGMHRLPGEFVRRLHQRTEGHPLFVVQLVNDLVEQGVLVEAGKTWKLAGDAGDGAAALAEGSAWLAVLETQVPRTVRAMIHDHLDRLERHEQQALEAAAAAGVEFSAAAVAAALGSDAVKCEEICDELVRRHRFLEKRGLSEWPDGTAATCYRFVHELYHSVVYEKISVARRGQLHQNLALKMEAAWGERVGEEAAGLAMHFEAARDWRKAIKHLRQAAETAGREYAHREAVRYLRRALTALDRLPPHERGADELHVLMALGVNMQVTEGFAAPEVEEIHARAYALCRSGGGSIGTDLKSTFSVLWGIWLFHKVRSDLRKADEMARQLLEMAEQSGEAGLMMQAHQAMCVTALCAGAPEVTRQHMERSRAIYDSRQHAGNTESFGQDPGVATLSFGAIALWLLNRPQEAMEANSRALQLAEQLGQPSSRALATHFSGMLHQMRGESAAVEACADVNIALSREEGFSFWLAGGMVLRGWARAARAKKKSEAQEAIEEIRRGVDAWLATGSRTYHTYHLGLLGDALIRLGRADEAIAPLKEGLDAARAMPEGLYEAELCRLMGEAVARLSRSNLGDSQKWFLQASEIARQQEAKWFEIRATEMLSSAKDHSRKKM